MILEQTNPKADVLLPPIVDSGGGRNLRCLSGHPPSFDSEYITLLTLPAGGFTFEKVKSKLLATYLNIGTKTHTVIKL